MSVHEPTPFGAAIPSVDADRAVKFGVGVAAIPLWAAYFTAAGAGMAYWWMTAAWSRREPKSFAPAKIAARVPAQAEARAPAPVTPAQPASRPPEVVAAPAAAPEPAPAASAAAPAGEAHPAPRTPQSETLAAATPVAAGLEPAVEPKEIAAVVDEAKPVQAAPPRAEGARAQAPESGHRKPPVRRRPEPKA